MEDFNSRNSLDYQRDPLDDRNLTGIYWSEAVSKSSPPPLQSNRVYSNGNSHDSTFSSLKFIIFLFLGFLCLMAMVWVFRFLNHFLSNYIFN